MRFRISFFILFGFLLASVLGFAIPDAQVRAQQPCVGDLVSSGQCFSTCTGNTAPEGQGDCPDGQLCCVGSISLDCTSDSGVSGTCSDTCSPGFGEDGQGTCVSGQVCCITEGSSDDAGDAGDGGTTGTGGTDGSTSTDEEESSSYSSGDYCDEGYEKMAGVCVPLSETVGGLSDREPGQVVVTVMQWLLAILGILAILMLVVAGMMYLTAAGDEKRTDTAKKIIMYVIIGVAVALTAYVIVMTVEQLVTGGEGELDPY